MFGTRQRAQVASNAHGLVGVWIYVEPRRSAIPLGDLRPLQWILFGVNLFRILIAEGNLQPLQQIHEKDFAQQARHSHNAASIPCHDPSVVLYALGKGDRLELSS